MNITTKRIALESASCVCVTFGDMGDADTNKPLFNDTAWKKADNILREILEGLISDPPGHSFYTYRLDKMGLRSLPNMDSGCFIVIEELMMSISTHMCRNGQFVGYPNLRVSDIF